MKTDPSNPPLLSEQQRQDLLQLVYHALVIIRYVGGHGNAERAADLADAVHNLPVEVAGVHRFDWNCTRKRLARYERKHSGNPNGGFVALLDSIRRGPTLAAA